MTILQIFIGLVLIASTLAVLASMYALYKSNIVKLGALRPDHPSLGPAQDFVTFHGGIERVERCSKTGIEVFTPIALLALVILILTFTNPPPLP
jgi:uncharacterized MAPEG superfamily protein